MNTLEGNKLIAEFMGHKFYGKYDDYAIPSTMYNIASSNMSNYVETFNIDTDWDDEKSVEYRIKTGGYFYAISADNLKYHSSWDWLMPCIGKISNICEEPEELDGLKYALLCNDIETAWNFVVDYLIDLNT